MCETDVPFELFLIVATPPVLEVAVTVAVTESPAEKLMPVKSKEASGNHSYQADTAVNANQID